MNLLCLIHSTFYFLRLIWLIDLLLCSLTSVLSAFSPPADELSEDGNPVSRFAALAGVSRMVHTTYHAVCSQLIFAE